VKSVDGGGANGHPLAGNSRRLFHRRGGASGKVTVVSGQGDSDFQNLTVEPEVRTGIHRVSPNAAPFTRWILFERTDISPPFLLPTGNPTLPADRALKAEKRFEGSLAALRHTLV
jgi:hypothetical protein